MATIDILGVKIAPVSLEQAVSKIFEFCGLERAHLIVTPNPEIVMCAQSNPKYLAVLNSSDLSVPDGTGLQMAAEFLAMPIDPRPGWRVIGIVVAGWRVALIPLTGRRFKRIPHRVTGVDLVNRLICEVGRRNLSVYFLGGAEGVAEEVARIIRANNPEVKVVGAASGGWINQRGVGLDDEMVLERINQVHPDILITAFGSPKQELWLANNLSRLNIKVAIGVGATFDFIVGRQKRAPEWVRKGGIEWLWRLIRQPTRLKRIWQAFPVFPLHIAAHKYSMLKSEYVGTH